MVANQIYGFEPKILAFLCNWCSYAGADMAGVSRTQYPSNIRTIRVMCSGRVDPVFIIEGFLSRADGIMILGCHPGDCHYSRGNYEAINTVNAVRKLLDYAGINEQRLLLDWVSASEGMRFRELVENFTGQIREFGHLGVTEGRSPEELMFELEAARRVAESEKFRWIMSKQTEFMQEGNKYGEKFTKHEMGRALEYVTIETLKESKILLILAEKPSSVREIAERISLPPFQVLRFIAGLRKRGIVAIHGIEGTSPLYCLANKEGRVQNGKSFTHHRRRAGGHPISA